MKEHTWEVISMGLGIVHGNSSKQKINTKISTDNDLLGVSGYIPWIIWSKKFLMGQDYNLKRCLSR